MVVAKPIDFKHNGHSYQVRAYVSQDSWMINVFDENGKRQQHFSVVPKEVVDDMKARDSSQDIRKLMEFTRDDFKRKSDEFRNAGVG